jgi:hypothetical protein
MLTWREDAYLLIAMMVGATIAIVSMVLARRWQR